MIDSKIVSELINYCVKQAKWSKNSVEIETYLKIRSKLKELKKEA